MKTVKFFTLGCKVNQYETQDIRESFIRAGYQEVNGREAADTYVINTCTVTSRADRKSRYYISRAVHQNPRARIVATGCLAQLDNEWLARIPGITHIVKNQDKKNIIRIVEGDAEFKVSGVSDLPGISSFHGHTRAFVKIQDGCDNRCSYCKVPLVRGVSQSRPVPEIIAEARRLVGNGYKEIVLCGICLGAYGRDLTPAMNIAEIIARLHGIEGLYRIRLSSIEAGDVSDALIDAMCSLSKLCRHLHIPMQSGDDEVLRSMNRSYSHKAYTRLVSKIKNRIPGIAITTDIMVGFPGERETHFRNTIALVKETLPARVHVFPYSPRPGTAAHHFKQRIDKDTVTQRLGRLNALVKECAWRYRERFLGTESCVLFEERSKRNREYWQGYTDTYTPVLVESDQNLTNLIAPVLLKKNYREGILGNFC